MSFELNQLIDGCLKGKQKQLTLPKLPKIVHSDALKITFEFVDSGNEPSRPAVNDLLTRFPVMESGYMAAKLIELNLLNKTEKTDQNKNDDEQSDDDTKSEEKRNIYEAWLEFERNEPLEFHPGDSIGGYTD